MSNNKKVIIGSLIAVLIIVIGIVVVYKVVEKSVTDREDFKFTVENISSNPVDTTNQGQSNIKSNRNPNNVIIKVDNTTIKPESVSITITDNNENQYGWGVEFRVQEKVNGEWKNLNYISDNLSWIDIAHQLNEDKQLTQKLDIEKYYVFTYSCIHSQRAVFVWKHGNVEGGSHEKNRYRKRPDNIHKGERRGEMEDQRKSQKRKQDNVYLYTSQAAVDAQMSKVLNSALAGLS